MKTSFILRLTAFVLASMCAVSCDGFLKEHSEDLAYIRSLDDLDELLIGSAYMTVHPTTPLKYQNFYIPFIHYISDETEEVIGTTRYNPEANIRPRIFGYYTWQRNVGTRFDGVTYDDESTDWLRFYNHISILNTILVELERMTPKYPKEHEQYNRIKAEALALRAIYHFLLANLYAAPYSEEVLSQPGIPLKTTNYIEDRKFQRATIEDTYTMIVEDLEQAVTLIAGVKGSSKYRLSEASILLMLSRVYLYMQNWDKAKESARKSIDLASALENYNGWDSGVFVHRVSSPEVLFSMGGSLLFTHLNSSSHTGAFQVSKELYDLFGEDDLRKTLFFKHEKDKGSKTGYVILPIKQNPRGPYRSEMSDIFCLRVSETYLNLAEACVMKGELNEAADSINKLLRMRKASAQYKPLTVENQASLIKVVREERRKELCLEGHRWFDLRRYRANKLFPERKELTNTYTIYSKIGRENKMSVTYYYTLPADEDAGYVLPIPTEQKKINDIIKDNLRVERTPSKTETYE